MRQMIKHRCHIRYLLNLVFAIVLFLVPLQKILAQDHENPMLCVGRIKEILEAG